MAHNKPSLFGLGQWEALETPSVIRTVKEFQHRVCTLPFQAGSHHYNSSWVNEVDIYNPRRKSFDQKISVQLEGVKAWEEDPGV